MRPKSEEATVNKEKTLQNTFIVNTNANFCESDT